MGIFQLQEALVTLATLLPAGSEQDLIYARYMAEGGVLDDEQEQNSDKQADDGSESED